ncbi:MAG: hypothetical protein SF052_09705 [Bacteroidia bacterium]|nr:hypothetical protein [Bacteroidia bacterium]
MERTVLRFLSTQNSYLETHYSFTYDSQNRLTQALYGEYNSSNAWQSSALNRYSVNPISYDDNGNITNLTRYGWISGSTYGDIDKLTYSYDGDYANQLTAISEISDLTRGFKKISSGADGYEYDNNGNLTSDGYRGITGITYNHLNLPAKITYSATKYLEFTYDASGRKWKKTAVDGGTTTEKYYFGPIEYNGSTLEALYHEEGRAVPDGNGGYDYEYAIRDHLGSTRVMFQMVNGTATIIQESHTYGLAT